MIDLIFVGILALWITWVCWLWYRHFKNIRAHKEYLRWREKELTNQFDVYIESLRQGHFRKPPLK